MVVHCNRTIEKNQEKFAKILSVDIKFVKFLYFIWILNVIFLKYLYANVFSKQICVVYTLKAHYAHFREYIISKKKNSKFLENIF